MKSVRVTEEWDWNVAEWAHVQHCGLTVEAVCFKLGMKQRALDRLLKETHGMSAQRLLDGFKIRKLRACLIGHLRMAAQRLWDSPGEFAKKRCIGELRISDCELRIGEESTLGRRDAGATAGRMPALRTVKRSKYFRTQPWEFFGLEEGQDEWTRQWELLGMLDLIRAENEFSIEALAVSLGFESEREFKRACLTVLGRTLPQIERIMAREIVQYYLAAEERELRAICARDDAFGMRAREIYCGDAEKIPTEPYCDLWSAWEQCKPEWVEKMREQFG